MTNPAEFVRLESQLGGRGPRAEPIDKFVAWEIPWPANLLWCGPSHKLAARQQK